MCGSARRDTLVQDPLRSQVVAEPAPTRLLGTVFLHERVGAAA